MAPAEHQSFEFEGCRFAYRLDGSGPPLVMIQGVGAQGISPNPQIEQISKHYWCLSLDNRGIGASQPAGRLLSAQQMAADTAALMRKLGWNDAHIVGHSFGGMVAMQLALQARSRVRSLALLCSFADGGRAARTTVELLWILLRIRLGTKAIRRAAFMELVLPPHHPELHSPTMAERLSAILGHDIADAPPITSQQLKAMRTTDLTARLHELAGIPTLVVNGDRDIIAPPKLGRVLADGIPGAQYVQVPGAAHSFPVVEPERCAKLLLGHLAKAEAIAPQTRL
jgi:pimeloyl-ACP methyl ester carboxylesterase